MLEDIVRTLDPTPGGPRRRASRPRTLRETELRLQAQSPRLIDDPLGSQPPQERRLDELRLGGDLDPRELPLERGAFERRSALRPEPDRARDEAAREYRRWPPPPERAGRSLAV